MLSYSISVVNQILNKRLQDFLNLNIHDQLNKFTYPCRAYVKYDDCEIRIMIRESGSWELSIERAYEAVLEVSKDNGVISLKTFMYRDNVFSNPQELIDSITAAVLNKYLSTFDIFLHEIESIGGKPDESLD